MKKIALMVLVVLCALSSTSFQMHAQAQDDIAKQFVGMWRLVANPQRLADGTTRQGANSVAYVIYTDTGHMCYVAMNPNRPKWKSVATPTAEEAMSGITGFGGYCATVEIHAKEGFVLHHVEIEKVPNIVGTTRKRWFTFQGLNRVALRVDTPIPPVVDSTLIWERVGK